MGRGCGSPPCQTSCRLDRLFYLTGAQSKIRVISLIRRNEAISRSFSQALWSDALYVRDWMNLQALDAGKLEKYAVLAHDLLRSFDLAHIVLRQLDKKTGGNLAARYLQRLTVGDEQPQMLQPS